MSVLSFYRLLAVSEGGFSNYFYDCNGERTVKLASGREQVYVNTAQSATDTAPALYFYHPDHLGSTAMVTNEDGHITQNVVYIPYGEVFVEERNGSWASPYLFNAKELDEETGLYYYGARYLDPTTAVWLSTDSLQEKYPGKSPYNYCAGNLVKLVDPDGEDSDLNAMTNDKKKNNRLVTKCIQQINAPLQGIMVSRNKGTGVLSYKPTGD